MHKSLIIGLLAVGFAIATALRGADAADNWVQYCATCHGRDGAGHTKPGRLTGARDLTDAAYQNSFNDDKAFNDLKNGLQKDGKTKMQPYSDRLTDDEIKARLKAREPSPT